MTETLRESWWSLYRYVVTRSRPLGARLDIRLLGPPAILVDGIPLSVDTRKAIAILALVAADARPYARDELAALLWPDSDDFAANGALRRTLSALRAAVGDGPLIIDRSRVDLDRRAVRVDLAEIETAMRSTDRDTLAVAADLARGEFMAGFHLRDSPDFDDWRATRAVAAERAVLTVLDRLAATEEAAGDLPAAIRTVSRRLDVDPLDEGGHLRLMELFVVAGDRSAALRQYRACVAILERELGVEPLASTTARYEEIRDVDPARPPESLRRLGDPALSAVAIGAPVTADTGRDPSPSRVLPLVGRTANVEAMVRVHAASADGAGRVLAIVGEAGIGKTRLGEELAVRVRAGGGIALTATAYPAESAIAYGPIVDLLRAALTVPDSTDRLARVTGSTRAELARLLPSLHPRGAAAAPSDVPGAHARLVAAIADGLTELSRGAAPGLIWIDDAQWLDASTREAIEFLVRRLSGRALTIALAWRPEDLDAETRAFADRMVTPPATLVEVERLVRDDVARLLASAWFDAAGTESPDPSAVDRLTAASEGLPLYLVEALASGSGALPETLPSGVSVVLRERLSTVSETAAQILAAASIIGRSFDLATLRHASGRSEDETVDALDEALRRGLIRETSTGFGFAHGALRDLAYDGTSLTRRRLLHRRVADALRLDLAKDGRDDLARLVLIAAHEREAGRDAEAAEAYRQAGERAAAVSANRDAIAHDEAALALGHPDAVGLHARIGRLRTRIGDYAGAISALEAAASRAAPADLPELEWALARAHLRRGDLTAATHHLDAASAAPTVGAALAARIWVDRSVILRRTGDPAAAAVAAGRALEMAGQAADLVAAGAAHRMLGLAALDAGDRAAAIDELRLALDAADEDPDPTARIAALAALAIATAAAGSTDAGLAYGVQAVEECRRIGDRHLEAAVENHLADLLHAAGRDEDAMPHLLRAVQAFAEVGGDPADPDPGIWMLSAS